jgi:hypothetical protein
MNTTLREDLRMAETEFDLRRGEEKEEPGEPSQEENYESLFYEIRNKTANYDRIANTIIDRIRNTHSTNMEFIKVLSFKYLSWSGIPGFFPLSMLQQPATVFPLSIFHFGDVT